MAGITFRPIDPASDLEQVAAWFVVLEDDSITAASLRDELAKDGERIQQQIAVGEGGTSLGFYWTFLSRTQPGTVWLNLYVDPPHRRQGVGTALYEHMLAALQGGQGEKLHVSLADDCLECLRFAEKRGFSERSHSLAMKLDLAAFDDKPYDLILDRLQKEGFLFTSMEQLGNSQEAQRKLYALNDMTSSETPGSEGVHAWLSFEDFQTRVCQSDWYKPAGQMLVIDSTTGDWVGLSAITRFEGADYAYNLHTGVDKRYRGRKLAQAVKITALRYAREALGVTEVRTNHNSRNLPMIAIDRKFGYVDMVGRFGMERGL